MRKYRLQGLGAVGEDGVGLAATGEDAAPRKQGCELIHGPEPRTHRKQPNGPDEFVARGRSKLVTPEERTPPCRSFSSTSSPPGRPASGEGWPGFWGLEGPEYLAWLGEQPEATYLMGANTYRLMSGFAAGEVPNGQDWAEEQESVDELTQASKVVFSSSLEEPLTWANSTRPRRRRRDGPRHEVEWLGAPRHDRQPQPVPVPATGRTRRPLPSRDVPVITRATGAERIYDGYPDVALEMIEHRTFDGRIQLVEYKPRVLEHPPLGAPA